MGRKNCHCSRLSLSSVLDFSDVPKKGRGETDEQAAQIFKNEAWHTFSVDIGPQEWSTAHRVGQSIMVRVLAEYKKNAFSERSDALKSSRFARAPPNQPNARGRPSTKAHFATRLCAMSHTVKFYCVRRRTKPLRNGPPVSQILILISLVDEIQLHLKGSQLL